MLSGCVHEHSACMSLNHDFQKDMPCLLLA